MTWSRQKWRRFEFNFVIQRRPVSQLMSFFGNDFHRKDPLLSFIAYGDVTSMCLSLKRILELLSKCSPQMTGQIKLFKTAFGTSEDTGMQICRSLQNIGRLRWMLQLKQIHINYIRLYKVPTK